MDIVLALGGGGVKGHAHTGVLRVLTREGFHVRALAGTSAGGLWGSLFAAGYTPDYIQKRMSEMDVSSIYARQPDDGPALLGLTGIKNLLREMLAEREFDDLYIPFAVTAVDLETAQEVSLRRGSVYDAVMSTIAVPGIFPPKKYSGRELIDGGVLDPVPVEVARSLAPGFPVVAVVLSPPLDEWEGPSKPRLFNSVPPFMSYLTRTRQAKAFNIFLRAVDIGGAKLTELHLLLDQPDVVIRPDVPQIGFLDPVNISEVVRLGELAAERALPALHQAISLKGWMARHINRRSYPGLNDQLIKTN